MTKHKMVCSKCGSEDVLRDAWAEWDVEKQDWVLQNVFDNAYCQTEEGECSIIMVEIEEPDSELDSDNWRRDNHHGQS